jgi:hypothetical protein
MRRIDDDNDDEVVRDGEGVRVPVYLIDTVRFQDGQPHFLRAPDAASKSTNLGDFDAARDAVRAARDTWIKQTCDAWKRTPTRDTAEPDAAEAVLRRAPAPHDDPEAALRRHLFGPDDDGAPDPGDIGAVERQQRERDLAWNRYRENLAKAWRTNPRAAPRIEREAESAKWRHGA